MKCLNSGVALALLMFLVQCLPPAAPVFADQFVTAVYPSKSLALKGEGTDKRLEGRLLFSSGRLLGPGGNKIGLQAFAFDERSRNIFTLQLNGARSGNQATINRVPLDGPVKRNSAGYSTPVSDDVGHQGLGIEYLDHGDFRLWTTAYFDARKVVRYSYADGHPPNGIEFYTLFGTDFRSRSSSTPAISYDQQYLIAVGLRKHASILTVRVWRLKDVVLGGPGDYSGKWLYEWDAKELIDNLHPAQGVASDGSSIWLVAGNNDIGVSKRLQAYTLNGSLVMASANLVVGKDQAMLDGAGLVYEPEGLAFFRSGNRVVLCVGIVSGDLGRRQTRIYEINKSDY